MAAFFLFAYLATVLIRPHEFVGFLDGVPLPLIFEVMTLCAWAFGKKKLNSLPLISVFILSICIFISLLRTSVSVGVSETMEFLAGQALVMLFVSNIVNSQRRHIFVFAIVVIAAVIIATHGHFQLASDSRIGWTGVEAMERTDMEGEVYQPRYLGIFSDPNDMGMLLAMSLPMVFFMWKNAGGWIRRQVWLGSAFLIAYGIILTNSRGSMLAGVTPLVFYLILKYNLLKAIAPATVAGVILYLLAPSRLFVSGDDSSQERIDAWYSGYLMLKSNPFFGVGAGNFLDFHHKTAHNTWVLAFAELGFVGFFFWLAVVFGGLYMTFILSRLDDSQLELSEVQRESLRKEKLIAAATMYAMIAALSAAFFLSRTYMLLLYLLAGLSVASKFRIEDISPDLRPKDLGLGVIFLSAVISIFFIMLVVSFKS